jgi:diguanylate cyclase (GGDEF)-like protein/PAS domain S-box-containing protein
MGIPPEIHVQQVSDTQNRNVLIVHPDNQRAVEIGELVERAGRGWAYRARVDLVDHNTIADVPNVIFISDRAFKCCDDTTFSDLRGSLPEKTILVGVIDSNMIDSPRLFGAGIDLILYQPLVLADIERAMNFAEAVHHESPQQARERLRKMTALHELAVASGHRTGTSGWLDRLVRAGCEILGADALAMWSLDRQSRRIRCIGSAGVSQEYIQYAEQQSPVLLESYEQLPGQLSTHWLTERDSSSSFRIIAPEAAHSTGIRQIAWLPVRDSNRLYGHLSFYFMSDATFEQYDLVLADAFSSIVAAALGTFWLQSEIRRTNRLYREHVEMSPQGVVICHPDGTIERSNPAVELITGYDQYEIIGESIYDWFMIPEDVPWNAWKQRDSNKPADKVELWLSRKNGERRRVACYARRVTFPDPRSLEETEHRIELVMQDVTVSARRLVELELFHDLSRLISERGSLDEAYELVVSRLYDYLNYRFVSIGRVIEGHNLQLQAYRSRRENLVVPTDMHTAMGLCGRAVRENRSILVSDVSTDWDYISIDEQVCSEIVAIIRASGQPFGFVDIQADASQPLDEDDLQLAESITAHLGLLIEQLTVHEQLERQALTDPLTGISNRRAFIKHLEALVENSESPPAALLLVELDNFKSVNDRYGHLFGDEMLKQVTGRLQTVLREGDMLARYGGDEIAMIFTDVSSEESRQVAERLRHAVAGAPFAYNDSIAELTVSIGIALYPRHGTTTDELIAEADRAMYSAKLQGRNSVRCDVPLGD